MNKSKIVLASIGGVAGTAALVMAYLIWSAYSGKSAIEADLAACESSVSSLSKGVRVQAGVAKDGKTKNYKTVVPSQDSIRRINEETKQLNEWKAKAVEFAASQVHEASELTPLVLKEEMGKTAMHYASQNGTVDGKFVKPDFAYGLPEFFVDKRVPSAEEMPSVQRKWNDIVLVVDALVEAGALQLVDVQVKPKEDEQKASQQNRRGRRGGAAAKKAKKIKPSRESYAFTFVARGDTIVKVLNKIAAGKIFAVVDSISFVREEDSLQKALTRDNKKKDGARGGRSGRTGGRFGARTAKADAGEKEEKENPIVTDLVMDAPHKVTINVSTYVFHKSEGEVNK